MDLINLKAVANFVAEMDLTKPKWLHTQNVFTQGFMQGWNSATRGRLIEVINELYHVGCLDESVR